MSKETKAHCIIAALLAAAAATSCGEKAVPPPESPTVEQQPDGPPITNGVDAGALDQHTMPDGTVMPGHEHHETAPKPAP